MAIHYAQKEIAPPINNVLLSPSLHHTAFCHYISKTLDQGPDINLEGSRRSVERLVSREKTMHTLELFNRDLIGILQGLKDT